MRKVCILALILLTLSQCTIFKKRISRPVKVYVHNVPILPTIHSEGMVIKYIHNVSEQSLAEGFMQNFLTEGRSTENVSLVNDPSESDFQLELVNFNITEKSNTQTINDSKSPYNGQSVVLNSVDCSVTYKITNTKHPERKLMNCSNSKMRSEKLKNNRDVGDLIFGTNKDHTQYRTKLLRDEICLDLAKDVGRRIWVPITRRIARNL